jgi:hypothetical protein
MQLPVCAKSLLPPAKKRTSPSVLCR